MNDPLRRLADLSPEKRLLLAKRLGASAQSEALGAEPVAIVGAACRFPGGAHDPESYWRMLVDGIDGIREVPSGRWDVDAFHDPDPDAPGKISSRWGGFLEAIDEFDASFFGIGPNEATAMDPQQRLLLEVTWEAIENAGVPRERLSASRTGVFFGVISSDYMLLSLADPDTINAYAGTGVSNSVATGRISHFLDLRGPSVTIDTACSASLVAIHLACQSLRARESAAALVGGVSVMASPQVSVAASKLSKSLVAQDGRCKTFDARADGLVRGEGCGVVVLKLLSDAITDGDRILAVIRGSAVNHDGKSAGLTAPNVLAQIDVMRQALRAAGVRPEQVSFIEAHGTGTSLGDPIEAEALTAVYGRAGGDPCALASVKTNFGHLEGAAGIAGLIKLALCLERGQIPPHLHFRSLHPSISFEGARFSIPTEVRAWDVHGGRRIGAVSSFGWSGTNAHVILEEPSFIAPRDAAEGDSGPFLLPLSARSPAAYKAYLAALRDRFGGTEPRPPLADVCYSLSARRTHYEHRAALVVRSWDDFDAQIIAALGAPAPRAAAKPHARAAEDARGSSLEELARLYALGHSIDWAALYPRGGRFVPPPRYPFQRRRFWIAPSPKEEHHLPPPAREPPPPIALSDSFRSALQPRARLWNAELDVRALERPSGTANGLGVSPFAVAAEVALAASARAFPDAVMHLEEISYQAPSADPSAAREMQAAIIERPAGDAEIQVFEASGDAFEPRLRGSLRRAVPRAASDPSLPPWSDFDNNLHRVDTLSYRIYGDGALAVSSVRLSDQRLLARVDVSGSPQSQLRTYMVELGLRALADLAQPTGGVNGRPFAPSPRRVSAIRAADYTKSSATYWIDARLTSAFEGGDVRILSERGAALMELCGVELHAPPRRAALPNGMEIAYQTRAELDHFYDDIFEKKIYLRNGITIEDGACVFDVGANIGLFSLFIGRVCPTASIFSFEPAPPLNAIARHNLARHGINASVFAVGLSDAERTSTFTFYPNSSGMSSFYAEDAEERAVLRAVFRAELRRGVDGLDQLMKSEDDLLDQRLKRETFTCRLRTLSDIIDESSVERIDLIKIDVQKCELEVLQGVREEHWPILRQIVIEVHDIDGRLAVIQAMLEGRGFKVQVEQDDSYEGSIMYNLYAIRGPREPLAERASRRAEMQRRSNEKNRTLRKRTT